MRIFRLTAGVRKGAHSTLRANDNIKIISNNERRKLTNGSYKNLIYF